MRRPPADRTPTPADWRDLSGQGCGAWRDNTVDAAHHADLDAPGARLRGRPARDHRQLARHSPARRVRLFPFYTPTQALRPSRAWPVIGSATSICSCPTTAKASMFPKRSGRGSTADCSGTGCRGLLAPGGPRHASFTGKSAMSQKSSTVVHRRRNALSRQPGPIPRPL